MLIRRVAVGLDDRFSSAFSTRPSSAADNTINRSLDNASSIIRLDAANALFFLYSISVLTAMNV